MPTYNLLLKAELENVESISASDSTVWPMKIECSRCQTKSPNLLYVSAEEAVEIPGARGECNCLYTCKEYSAVSALFPGAARSFEWTS